MHRQLPVPIVALDVPSRADAERLLERLGPGAGFVKVGLQLFTAEGPDVVRALRARGCRVFLDIKLHDIPTTVARAVRSVAGLDAELLTVHASGGRAMLAAAQDAAEGGPKLLAVTVLTSLSAGEVAEAWGRDTLRAEDEVARLASLAAETGMHGVVASVREAAAVRRAGGGGLRLLAPGIRLAGDDAGDQARTATPTQAAVAGAHYVVLGRSITAAADPAAALARAVREMEDAARAAVPTERT